MKKHLYNKVNKKILKEKLIERQEERTTLSFYKYAQIEDPEAFRDEIYAALDNLQVFGRIYVAGEGINAQISVPDSNFDACKTAIYKIPFLDQCRLNVAIEDDGLSFEKLMIKVRPKIVADGLNDETFDVTNKGVHVDAEAFNKLAEQEDTVIVDMRNHYESEVGHFENAICPDVETFRESLPIIEDMLQEKKDKTILMYCTGGIRCEKASAYFKHRGFDKVHQLDGGIIEYARQVNQKNLDNKFKGKNFVFDHRLGERITEDVVAKCHQCGIPCDMHNNCANDACHILFIQCPECAAKYENCCSLKCKDFNQLPEEEQKRLKPKLQFNGTQFGKGRYKALHQHETLHLE